MQTWTPHNPLAPEQTLVKITRLEEENAILRAKLANCKAELKDCKAELEICKVELKELRRLIFGQKSERFMQMEERDQPTLFDDVEAAPDVSPEAVT